MTFGPITLHATCVALGARGILIRGASGAGKSALALQLMGHGAQLVADDQTILTRHDDAIFATCPPNLRGMIEARGIGLLAAKPRKTAKICLIVDLDQIETDRLPPKRNSDLMGVPIDLVFGSTSGHLPYGVLQYARAGRLG